MADIRTWSQTASSNTDLFPEGMAPSAVNDGMRTVQAEIAQLIGDEGGTLTLGGTGTAYTLTLNTAPTSLTDGLYFSATANVANTGAATLVVTPAGGSAFASKKIKVFAGSVEADPPPGALSANGHYLFQYDSAADSGTGAYILLNPTANGLVQISSGTASSVATLEISLPTSGYEELELSLTNVVPATSLATLNMRVSHDGTTYRSGAGDYAYALSGYRDTAAAANSASTGNSVMLIIGAMSTASAAYAAAARISIPMPSDNTRVKQMRINCEAKDSTGNYFLAGTGVYGGGTSGSASSALLKLQFLMSSGNIASVTWALRGRRI